MTRDRQSGVAARAVRALGEVRKLASRPSLRPWLLGTAVLTFVGLAYVSFGTLDEQARSAEPLLVAPLILVAAPAMVVCNALEYRAMARMLDHHVPLRSAAHVSLTATLANYLPAPGGVAVRTAALKGRGSTVGAAVSVNGVGGLLWAGLAALTTGTAFLVTGTMVWRGAAAIAGGLGAVAVAALWSRRRRTDWWDGFRRLLLVEAAIVAVAGLRAWLALHAIGEEASVGAAVAISSSSVIAAAVGVLPGGIGLREAIGGAMAVAVNVPWGASVAALAGDRAAGLVGAGLCALVLGVRRRDVVADVDGDGATADGGEPVDPGEVASGADASDPATKADGVSLAPPASPQ